MIHISVLGPVGADRAGRAVAVPGGKTGELLARLAVEPGAFVTTDRLLEDLWGETALTTRRNTLQSKVARLRRALGDPRLVVRRDAGYALAVDPCAVDAVAVVRESAAASALLAAGDQAGAAELSASALARYRGEPLHGAGDWAVEHRARLDAARMELLETQLAARLGLGGAGALVGELESAVAAYPFRERLWELLLTALYRAGRQAEALAGYQRVRSLLADSLGLEPGPGLQDLQRRILVQDPALGSGGAAAGGAQAPAGNLPSLTTELVGREAEVSAVCELLASRRLIEIVGAGGVGKTALAIAAGRRLLDARGTAPGSVWLARLEDAATPDDVLDAVVAALQVAGGPAALVERLKAAPTVLVLDNCEHVLDAAAVLVTRLLDAVPGLRILCTSQIPLNVDGEAVFALAPLPLPDAVELFTRRAAGHRRAPGADEEAVADLCRSLDGLPLAIELAAARTQTLSLAEIGRRLDDRFSILSDPTSRRPERRRALGATIRWSYELLFPDDQRGLWALAAFAGGAQLAATESVLEALGVPASAAIDVVGRLASRSLVIVEEDATAVRYRLLDSIRAFALNALAERGLSDTALAAHAAWFAVAAAGSTQGVRGGRQAEHLAFARAERANIDTALAWSAIHDPSKALDIVIGFGWAWIVLGDHRGAQRIVTALAAAGDGAPARDRAAALLLAAWLEASADRLDRARAHIAEAARLADRAHDADLAARCASHLAYVVSHEGDWHRAMELTDRADALYEGLDRPWDQAANWLFAARAAISAGDRARAAAARDQVEERLRSLDDPWLHVRRDAMLGELARIEHRFDDAVRHLARAADTSKRLGFRQAEAYQLSGLGRAQCQAGDYVAGANTLASAVGKAEATGDVRLAALARTHLGRVLRALDQVAPARAALESATAWHRTTEGGEQAALGECLLAALDAADGVAGAEQRLGAILDEAQAGANAPVEVFALDALARRAAGGGDTVKAEALLELADRRMQGASHFITEADRTDCRLVRQGRAARAGASPAGG